MGRYITENTHSRGVSTKPEGLRCLDCGAAYASLGCDLVLPDQQWKAIFPEDGGILCANCICQRASRLGATVVMAWLDSLDYSLLPTFICAPTTTEHKER